MVAKKAEAGEKSKAGTSSAKSKEKAKEKSAAKGAAAKVKPAKTQNKKTQSQKDDAAKINRLRAKLTNDDQKKIFDATIKSEISGRASNAYKLVRAQTKNSGYSFGWVQFDLPGNKSEKANSIISAAVNNISEKDFDEIVKEKKLTVVGKDKKERPLTKKDLINMLLKVKGEDIPAVEAFKGKINKELESGAIEADGKKKKLSDMIDELSISHIEEIEAHAEKAVKGYKNPEAKLFAKLFVADVKNQFGTKVNNALKDYISGEEVEMPYLKGVNLKARGKKPDLLDLFIFHQNTKYAKVEKKGGDLARRFNNIFLSAMDGKGLNNESAREYIKSCLSNGKMNAEDAEFLLSRDGIASNFKEDKNTFMQTLIKNKVLSNLITMGVERHIENKKIKDMDMKTAALLTAIYQNIGGLEKDKKLKDFLKNCEENPNMAQLISHYLKYAKKAKDKNVKENCIKSLKELEIEIKNEEKLKEVLNSKHEDDDVDKFVKKNITASGHCNAWNHKLTCCCGFGGPR